ncbi:nucleotidyltransferase/DNA polymerase involved in DNA repair [Bradyrhizobium sp. LM3.2]
MSRSDLRQAALRGLQGDQQADPRHLRRAHSHHRAVVARRGLSRRDGKTCLQCIPLARDIALRIRERIKAETGLNASAGISYNKFLAKLASDHRKPNGQFVISPEMGPAFVEALPVGKFHGIGPATGAKMNALGMFTGLDIRRQTLEFMNANFGKSGAYYYWISRGVDERPVRADRVRKSIGAETTFSIDLNAFDALVAELKPLVDKVWRHCEATRQPGPHRHLEDQICRLRDHHAQQVRTFAGCGPGRSGAVGLRPARIRNAATQARQAAGGIAVCPPDGGRRAAADFRHLILAVLNPS